MRAVLFELLRRTGSWVVCFVLKRLISYAIIFTFFTSKAKGGSLGCDMICMNAYYLTRVRWPGATEQYQKLDGLYCPFFTYYIN